MTNTDKKLSNWLIASDIDGTINDKGRRLVKRNYDAIHRFIDEYNGNFTLASGRSPDSMRKHYKRLDIADGKAIVINGAGMETFLHDLEETVEDLPVVDSSVGIEFLCGHSHEHEEATEHSHNHQNNSHIWMSVENAKKQVLNIKDGLVEIFPQYKSEISANCEVYLGKLNVLDNEMQTMGESLKDINVITFHGAYEYMAEDMGFNIVSTIESDEGGEPSAKELAHLCGEIEENGVKALFVEPHYDGSAAQVLSDETGAKIYVLNPVISGENSLTAYEDIMRQNIEIIKKAVK